MFKVFKYKEHGIRRAQLKVLSECFTCVSLLQHPTGTNWRQNWQTFLNPGLSPSVTVLMPLWKSEHCWQHTFLIWILGYECYDRLCMNVVKDGYECYEFDIGWVWLFISSGYLDTNVMIGLIRMLKRMECHDRLDTNVEKDGYECY